MEKGCPLKQLRLRLLNRLEEQAIRSLRVILKIVHLREANKNMLRNVQPLKIFLKIFPNHS